MGDQPEACAKDLRHGPRAYGQGGRDGSGLELIGWVLDEGEPSEGWMGVAIMVYALIQKRVFLRSQGSSSR
jgi:hypothetical protein